MQKIPDEEYDIFFGQAAIRKKGSDVTVVALAKMVYEALAAADELQREGISAEVIDPRTLVPLDTETIKNSVCKTGKLVLVDEACPFCGVASEIVSQVVRDDTVFRSLQSAPKLVTGFNVPMPYSPPMAKYVVPDKHRIILAINEAMGHQA